MLLTGNIQIVQCFCKQSNTVQLQISFFQRQNKNDEENVAWPVVNDTICLWWLRTQQKLFLKKRNWSHDKLTLCVWNIANLRMVLKSAPVSSLQEHQHFCARHANLTVGAALETCQDLWVVLVCTMLLLYQNTLDSFKQPCSHIFHAVDNRDNSTCLLELSDATNIANNFVVTQKTSMRPWQISYQWHAHVLFLCDLSCFDGSNVSTIVTRITLATVHIKSHCAFDIKKAAFLIFIRLSPSFPNSMPPSLPKMCWHWLTAGSAKLKSHVEPAHNSFFFPSTGYQKFTQSVWHLITQPHTAERQHGGTNKHILSV